MPYGMDGAIFDGSNDYLTRVSDFDGLEDSSKGILSFWIKFNGGNGVQQRIIRSNTLGHFNVTRNTSNKLVLDMDSQPGANVLNITSTQALTVASGLIHIMASWDTNFVAGQKKAHLYIQGVNDNPIVVDVDPAADIDYTDLQSIAADSAGAQKLNATIGDFYFAPGQYLDLSLAANRAKFYSNGQPVHLGPHGALPTGSEPIAFFHIDNGQAAANFAVNRGSGGDMTINGSLTSEQLFLTSITPISKKVQQSSPGELVNLFQIQLTKLGGPLLYFTPLVKENQEVIMFDGIAYAPVPVEITGFERSGKDPFPRPRVKMGNVNKLASALVRDWRDLVGAKIIHIQTFADYLDDGSDPDPGQYLPLNVYRVERKVNQVGSSIEWELSAAIDQQGRKLPGRQVLRICQWRYRKFNILTGQFEYDNTERACPYTGDNSYDRNENPVGAADDRCSHTLAGCKARFGQFAELPYGGFPAVGLSV